jgi:hypothetical protein
LPAGLPEGIGYSLESKTLRDLGQYPKQATDFCADKRMLAVSFRMTAVTLAPAEIISE